MTFGISRDKGAFEWSGTSGTSLFAQQSNIIKPGFWRMIFDIVRFNQFALDLLSTNGVASDLTIGEYLEKEGYSDAFRDDYLVPMTACVWSTGPDKCALEFPALTLVRFMWNHHLLTTVAERPPWLTIEGGSKKYIDAVMRECAQVSVHLGRPVESATRKDGRVELRLGGRGDGRIEVFDEVVLACHGDQARRIVGEEGTGEEREIMKAFETSPNMAYLHSDLSVSSRHRHPHPKHLLRRTAHAQTPHRLVRLELHHHIPTPVPTFQPHIWRPSERLLNLQHEHPAISSGLHIRRHPRNFEPGRTAGSGSYTSYLSVPTPTIQCPHDC